MSGRFWFTGVAALGVWLVFSPAFAQEGESENLAQSNAVTEEVAPPPVVETVAEPVRNPAWPALIPTENFASRSALFDTQLSPDGTKFAFRMIEDDRTRIAVFNADTLRPISTLDVGEGNKMKWFKWAGNNRIIFSTRSSVLIASRFFPGSKLTVHDLVSGQTSFVGLKEQGFEGDDVLYVDPAGQYVLISLSDTAFSSPSVYRFRLDGSGASTAEVVEKRQDGIRKWWADNTGVVRLAAKPSGRANFTFYYRGTATEPLTRVTKLQRTEDEFDNWDVLSIKAGTDTGYALVEDERGLDVLREFNYRTGQAGKLVHKDPVWGLDGALLTKDGVLEGAIYTADAPQTRWFDSKMAAVQSRLEQTFGQGRVRILSRSDDGRRMVVWHGGGGDPGVIYVYTPGRNRLETFAAVRPDVDFKALSAPRRIDYQARDGVKISGYLTLPKGRDGVRVPLVIMPHGGPYGVRDTMTYRDEVQLLANRGYAVLQPNFRGSGGFGEAFEKLGDGQIGRKMQDDLDDAMDWAVAQGFADAERVCVVGGSYGGYAALWAVIRNPERYRCAASWAGVTDFDKQLAYDRNFFTRRNDRRWRQRIEGEQKNFELDDVSPALNAEKLTRPILLAHGRKDGVVPFSQFTAMERAIDAADIDEDLVRKLIIDDARHSFIDKDHEKAWYDALVRFLADHNPSDVNTPEVIEAEEARVKAEAEAAALAAEEAAALAEAEAQAAAAADAKVGAEDGDPVEADVGPDPGSEETPADAE